MRLQKHQSLIAACLVLLLGAGFVVAAKPRTITTDNPDAWRVALHILNGNVDFSFESDDPIITPSPIPEPTTTPLPTETPEPTASPCPSTIHISNTGPGSAVHFSCHTHNVTHNGSSSNISIFSSSNQFFSTGSSTNSNNTHVTITHE